MLALTHDHLPQIVGFGVVEGEARTSLPGFEPPAEFGSLRKLSPFVPWSGAEAEVDLRSAVSHTRALAQLHPKYNEAHREICVWMERHIERTAEPSGRDREPQSKGANRHRTPRDDQHNTRKIALVALPGNYQLDYQVRSAAAIKLAQRQEAILLSNYQHWLKRQDRKLDSVKIGALQCDGYEELRHNLIDARPPRVGNISGWPSVSCSITRSKVRHNLSPHAWRSCSPKSHRHDIEAWLDSLKIKLVWPEGDTFLDNANGQFT